MNPFVNKLQRLAPLSDAAKRALMDATAKTQVYNAGHDLVREGDKPGPLFVILEGWACRYKILPMGTRQILAFLMPGDSCDLHAGLATEMDHGIQTITACRVASIDRTTIDRLFEEHPSIIKAMYLTQLIDESTLRAWITSIGRRTSIERMAHLICELYLRARRAGLRENEPLALPLSQIILADALGMSAIHVNRVLKELRITGVMTVGRGSLNILHPNLLGQIAGFDDNYLHRRLVSGS